MRTNTKTVVKSYDTDTFNDWILNYEYESQDGAVPSEIRVTGTKGVSSIYISKTGSNISVNFGGGSELDAEVIASVKEELSLIVSHFTEETK
jgi:hypothetical protein